MKSSFAIAAVASLFVAAANAQPADSTFVVRLEPRSASATQSGVLTLLSATEPAQRREVAVRNGAAQLTEDAGSVWELRFATDGWWSPSRTITFPAAGVTEQQTLPVWRTGIIMGRLTAGDKDIELPKSITLTVESPPQPVAPPAIARGTTFDCPVTADGRWSCRIPATTVDLVLRQKGITPHYRWGVAVAANEPKELGTFVLKRGASFTAWLDRASTKKLKSPARARLVRSVTPLGGETSARLSVPVAEASFNANGAVQLAPLPAGIYILEVWAEGFATARISPVEIYRGSESVFRKPIELHPPITVAVSVDPPADPAHTPWRINWQRSNDFVSGADPFPPFSAAVDKDGAVKIPGQEPGAFSLKVLNASGDRIADRSLVIHDEHDAVIRVQVESHDVKGTLRLGGEPLAGTLWFGSRSGVERVRMTSNAEGKFAGSLPRRGKWALDVESSEPALMAMSEVTVPDDGKALEIDLPDTKLSGWVVGSDGQRSSSGSVVVRSGARSFVVRTQIDGTFTARALPPGVVHLLAEDRRSGEKSAGVDIPLADGEKREGVELRIDPTKAVVGIVISRGQPVIGASVSGLALEVGSQIVASTATDVTGRFVLYVAQRAQRARFTVGAPGRTLQTFDVAITPTPITLELEPIGGVIELVVSGPFRLSRNGMNVPVSAITDWMSGHGDPLSDLSVMHIPDLAPGRYEVCSTGSATPACVGGELAPGGTLRLVVPK
ncbi:MAG: hypothetical protein JWO97_1563 [Acidobacteria bacterium]|nr:hypothetical protein [Acidobacteriota bacterium]